jgi:hypothetical protein
MGTGTEIIAIAAIVGSVASTGVAMYGQMQQAQAAAQMAAYNQNLQMQAAQIAANNAMVQNQLMSQQNALAQQQALASQNAIAKNMQNSQRMNLLNQRNLQSRSDSQIMAMQNNALIAQRNAASQDQEANLVEAQARERARRQREQNEKVMSALRGRQGKSAVTFEGSPLMVMAETAGLMELGVADAFYEAGLQSQALRTKADAGRYGSALELWQTRFVGQDAMMDGQVMDLKAQAELSNLNLERQSAQYELAAAQYQGSALVRQRGLINDQLTYDMNAARGTYMQGMNQSQAYQIGAYGTLLSGASQAAGAYVGYRRDVKAGVYS